MRLANAGGRASLLVGDRLFDLERASRGRFASDPMVAIAVWDDVLEWAGGLRTEDAAAADAERALREEELGPPVPRPSKVFGIGLNYRGHAGEAGLKIPEAPVVFTKFPSCLVGPRADVVLPSAFVDFEVELVVAIGRRGRSIAERNALDHVAGYCVGQDISDRRLQFDGERPQFSMGKSIDTFGPIGPALVSLDTFPDPNDLGIECEVAGERMQEARTSDMIFSVPELVAYLSSMCTLEPADLIFTGTPSGVGSLRSPRRYLAAGQEIVSSIEHIGTMVNRCVAAGSRA